MIRIDAYRDRTILLLGLARSNLAAARAHDIPKSPARVAITPHADGAVVVRSRRPGHGERQRAGDGRLLRERVEALV